MTFSATDTAALRDLVTPVLTHRGLLVEDIAVHGDTVVITVDTAATDIAAAVTLDELAAATTEINTAVDDADLGGEPYVLEVGSVGAERPLRERRHWQRAQGRLAAMTLPDGTALVARVGQVDGDTVTLVIPAPKGTGRRPATRVESLADLKDATVRVEFGSPNEQELRAAGLDDDQIAARRRDKPTPLGN